MNQFWSTFVHLVATPFAHVNMVWGIVPLYFGLMVNELTGAKANFRTAFQTGFSFIWASAQWLWPYFASDSVLGYHINLNAMVPVNLMVTFLVLGLGVVALISGIRKRFPQYGRFLGHTRFANYFMIMIFPIQSHFLDWTWERLVTIVIFAVPVWLVLHFGLMPLRSQK
jgi:hypothetical protein